MNNVNCRRDIAELHYCWKQRKTLKIPPQAHTHAQIKQTQVLLDKMKQTDIIMIYYK